MVDHLFRHQSGKMVSILVRIFGIQHLETIEDAVQDTFISALNAWKTKIPQNPEAWLTAAAKNRVVDIFRKINSEQTRKTSFQSGTSSISISEMFLDHQIEDSQLRMIFTACHPSLAPKEQIAFALKTISGFSSKEIASSLLTPVETIKKRLQRARKTIIEKDIAFDIPQGKDLNNRLDRVMEVLYLIFNEGFHSAKKEVLLRKDLCGEAMRLSAMVLKKEKLRNPKFYALFALMCFHSSRLESKISPKNEVISIRHQDRSLWNTELIFLGNDAMHKAVNSTNQFSSYHYEAAIASEHLRAKSFEKTDWKIILKWYQSLFKIQPNQNNLLSIAIVQLQLKLYNEAFLTLTSMKPNEMGQRQYLYYASLGEYHKKTDHKMLAIKNINIAIELVSNDLEKIYLLEQKDLILAMQ